MGVNVVDGRNRLAVDPPFSRVTHDSDNLAKGIRGVHDRIDLFAKRLSTVEELPHKLLIHNEAIR